MDDATYDGLDMSVLLLAGRASNRGGKEAKGTALN